MTKRETQYHLFSKIKYSITVEDIRKWQAELDAKNIPERQYRLYIYTTRKNFKKIWIDALIKAGQSYLNPKT